MVKSVMSGKYHESFPNQLEDKELTKKLLEEERKLRATQPEPWIKQKHRKWTHLGTLKSEVID